MKAEQINEAAGEAEAILLKATATARGINAVAESMREGRENAQGAVSLRVAERYVDAFGRLAKEGTAIIVPGNVGDMGGMIASAMAVYGKVSEGQKKSMSARMLGEAETDVGNQAAEATEQQGKANAITETVLEGFEKARKANR